MCFLITSVLEMYYWLFENKVETCLHCMKISCLFFLLIEQLWKYLDLLTSSWGNQANPTKCGNIRRYILIHEPYTTHIGPSILLCYCSINETFKNLRVASLLTNSVKFFSPTHTRKISLESLHPVQNLTLLWTITISSQLWNLFGVDRWC